MQLRYLQRALVSLSGGLLGVLVGWVLSAPPVKAFFLPATVSWDGSVCEPGTYSISSNARNTQTNATFNVTTNNVALPVPLVSQTFSDLPPGTYEVTATVRGEGREFAPATQYITVYTPAGDDPAAGALPGSRRRRPAPLPPTPSGSHTKKTTPSTSYTGTGSHGGRTDAGVTPPDEVPAAKSRIKNQSGDLAVLAALFDADPSLGRIELLDSDDDGVIDVIRIAWTTGEVWTWQRSSDPAL